MSDHEIQLFEDLAFKYMDNLYSRAILLARSAERAEILVQQTYAVAFGVFQHFDKNSDFDKWLNEILMNVYANMCFYVHESAEN
ncbi:MAG: hypothetical protein EHM72_06495 [Calditrichaeota bacterium]|nr:MAG: hypothetical protein EHM72_06495 [Calditrichota bacterium]